MLKTLTHRPAQMALAPLREATPFKLVVLAALLVFSAEVSRFFTLPEQAFSVIWPPAGLLLGALLVYSSRNPQLNTLPGMIFGCFIGALKPLV